MKFKFKPVRVAVIKIWKDYFCKLFVNWSRVYLLLISRLHVIPTPLKNFERLVC